MPVYKSQSKQTEVIDSGRPTTGMPHSKKEPVERKKVFQFDRNTLPKNSRNRR